MSFSLIIGGIIRLDHIAYRVNNRKKTSQFFIDAFGYKIQQEFDLQFPDGTFCLCIALEPPEKIVEEGLTVPWIYGGTLYSEGSFDRVQDYHLAPEIFVSDGSPTSIVGQWVQARGGIGGIHHMAYQVPNVAEKMAEWKMKGWGDFTSEKPFQCEGLTQVFSTPHALTGVVYEFIERTGFGFCKSNVKQLMMSTVKTDATA